MPATLNIPNCDVAMLKRIIEPNVGDLPLAAAKTFLKFDFDQSDRDRMRVLVQKAQQGSLTKDEEAEAEDYERVGHLLDMLHSKARKAIKKHANGR